MMKGLLCAIALFGVAVLVYCDHELERRLKGVDINNQALFDSDKDFGNFLHTLDNAEDFTVEEEEVPKDTETDREDQDRDLSRSMGSNSKSGPIDSNMANTNQTGISRNIQQEGRSSRKIGDMIDTHGHIISKLKKLLKRVKKAAKIQSYKGLEKLAGKKGMAVIAGRWGKLTKKIKKAVKRILDKLEEKKKKEDETTTPCPE
jgi:hypothetical protein